MDIFNHLASNLYKCDNFYESLRDAGVNNNYLNLKPLEKVIYLFESFRINIEKQNLIYKNFL